MEESLQKVYMFSRFLPYSNPSALLIHANEASKLWHERFGHLNYKYLFDLSEKDMVIGLPKIKFSKGVCQGCILGVARGFTLACADEHLLRNLEPLVAVQ